MYSYTKDKNNLFLLQNRFFLSAFLNISMALFSSGTFVNLFFLAYLISPKFCHRFVGYLEEEAVKTYTHCIEVSEHPEDGDYRLF